MCFHCSLKSVHIIGQNILGKKTESLLGECFKNVKHPKLTKPSSVKEVGTPKEKVRVMHSRYAEIFFCTSLDAPLSFHIL